MWLGLAVWGSLEVVFLAVALPTENYVTVVFAGLYVLAGIAVHWLRIPEEAQQAVVEGLPLAQVAAPATERASA
nr:hypothetical protein OG999_12555 [Streptomyces sp. NBC_00886]